MWRALRIRARRLGPGSGVYLHMNAGRSNPDCPAEGLKTGPHVDRPMPATPLNPAKTSSQSRVRYRTHCGSSPAAFLDVRGSACGQRAADFPSQDLKSICAEEDFVIPDEGWGS